MGRSPKAVLTVVSARITLGAPSIGHTQNRVSRDSVGYPAILEQGDYLVLIMRFFPVIRIEKKRMPNERWALHR